MNKKSVLGLLLFSCIVIAGMFLGTMLMIGQETDSNYVQNQENNNEDNHGDGESEIGLSEEDGSSQDQSLGIIAEEWLFADETVEDINNIDDDFDGNEDIDSPNTEETDEKIDNSAEKSDEDEMNPEVSNPSSSIEDADNKTEEDSDVDNTRGEDSDSDSSNNQDDIDARDTIGENVLDLPDMKLIRDSNQVDYMKYIPDMVFDSKIEVALDIVNPPFDLKAKSAILFDADTRKVLYYKDPVIPVFPASTSKLLTALVALDWCMEEEEVVVGGELELVASDSTLASLKEGQILSIRNLIEGMLVPSGNDAAYVTATYVGRKSLNKENASLKEALPEFIRLMNNKAKSLGAINSNFLTPDGYDAIGQYTTAYDMGMVGMAAADNETIVEISNKSRARNVFVDGSDITWSNTNSLIKRDSGRYYPYCLGLKTGTSTMAGRCLISVAEKDGRKVVSVVMNSDSVGRWEDSTALLKYGLNE